MPTGFRNSGGVDFEDLFEAGTTQAAGFRLANGTNVQFAARGAATKGPNVGYRTSGGVDLSELWLPKGGAAPVLGFNGQTYDGTATAPTNQPGNTSAQLALTIASSGGWTITRSIAGSLNNNGTVTLASGTWLPAGQAVSDYQVQFSGSAVGGATMNNGAPSYASCSTSRTISLQALVVAASSDDIDVSVPIGCLLRRVSTGAASASNCTFNVRATGWL